MGRSIGDIAHVDGLSILMALSAIGRGIVAEDIVLMGATGIDGQGDKHVLGRHRRIEPALDEIVEQCLARHGVLGRALDLAWVDPNSTAAAFVGRGMAQDAGSVAARELPETLSIHDRHASRRGLADQPLRLQA